MKKIITLMLIILAYSGNISAFYPAFLNVNDEQYLEAVMDIEVDEQYISVSKVDGLVVIDKSTGQKNIFSKSHGTFKYTPTVLTLHEGALWIGTDAGIIVTYRDGKFEEHDYGFSEKTSIISAITFDSKGAMYIADSGTVYMIEGNRSEMLLELFPITKSGMICQMTFDDEENLWLGAYGLIETSRCLAKYSKNGQLEIVFETSGELPSGYVYALKKDRKGGIWYSCQGKLTCLMNERYKSYEVNRVWDMAIDSSEKLWMTPDNGPLMMVDGEDVKKYECPIKTNRWFCIEIDSDDILIGTDIGILRYTSDMYELLDVSIPSNTGIISPKAIVNSDRQIIYDTSGKAYYPKHIGKGVSVKREKKGEKGKKVILK